MKENPTCHRCKIHMAEGKAIEQSYIKWDESWWGYKLSKGGPGKLIDCYKCPQCGHSLHKEEWDIAQEVMKEDADILAMLATSMVENERGDA